MSGRLEDKRIVVTAAANRIGNATATAFARQGIAGLGRPQQRLVERRHDA